jgi:hypothetical protein
MYVLQECISRPLAASTESKTLGMSISGMIRSFDHAAHLLLPDIVFIVLRYDDRYRIRKNIVR